MDITWLDQKTVEGLTEVALYEGETHERNTGSDLEGISSDPADDNAEQGRQPNGFGFLECALELETEFVASGDSDLLELGSYMGIPILTPRKLLEEVGEVPEE